MDGDSNYVLVAFFTQAVASTQSASISWQSIPLLIILYFMLFSSKFLLACLPVFGKALLVFTLAFVIPV